MNRTKRTPNQARKEALRHNRIEIKLSDEELAVVKKNAEFMKMPVGRYIRRIAVQGEIIQYDLSKYNYLISSLNKVGSELNQIAKVANSTGEIYQKDIEDMQKIFKYYSKAMSNNLAPLKGKTVNNAACGKICLS